MLVNAALPSSTTLVPTSADDPALPAGLTGLDAARISVAIVATLDCGVEFCSCGTCSSRAADLAWACGPRGHVARLVGRRRKESKVGGSIPSRPFHVAPHSVPVPA